MWCILLLGALTFIGEPLLRAVVLVLRIVNRFVVVVSAGCCLLLSIACLYFDTLALTSPVEYWQAVWPCQLKLILCL